MKIQDRCTHSKGFELVGDEFICKECKAVGGYAGSPDSEDEEGAET